MLRTKAMQATDCALQLDLDSPGMGGLTFTPENTNPTPTIADNTVVTLDSKGNSGVKFLFTSFSDLVTGTNTKFELVDSSGGSNPLKRRTSYSLPSLRPPLGPSVNLKVPF